MKLYAGRFQDRVAVITGGASGVGRDAAARIAAEGGRVFLWDRDDAALAAAAAAIPGARTARVDVADAAEVARAAEAAFRAGGRLDVLIASAGITGPTATLWEYPVEEWRRVIDVDLHGIFNSCRAIVPLMLRNDYGRIVNISSVAGKEGNPKASAYSAAKAGVIGLTKSLGKELALTGVRVNCVTPATFKSPILTQLPQSQIDYMKSKIPMGRLGEVEEVAALVCWLASEECSFSTAATFDISGGRTTY
ncbi:MAG TPA: SDR family NAD(P)-dependent oxidoreductase [Steroidobacteraceae bacterium]|nr:SDR family NAD(P)-dependent oxidoreductase [Steroidobacteraceae bacterium]